MFHYWRLQEWKNGTEKWENGLLSCNRNWFVEIINSGKMFLRCIDEKKSDLITNKNQIIS